VCSSDLSVGEVLGKLLAGTKLEGVASSLLKE
jgi:hypothetical protein